METTGENLEQLEDTENMKSIEDMEDLVNLENQEDDAGITEEMKKNLTPDELRRLEKGETTPQKLAQERKKYKKQAEKELLNLSKVQDNKSSVIDVREYKTLKEQLDAEQSPQKMQELLEKIQGIPQQKEREKAKDIEDSKELPLDHPKLGELKRQFNQICDKNAHLIGTKQVPGFKSWFAQELQKNPTIKYGRELIKRLEGKEVTDSNGLGPRREEFAKLEKIFKKYEISNPLDSDYIKQEGLSERKQFRENLEKLEDHLDHQKDTGFYSKEMMKKSMQDVMKMKTTSEQNNYLTKAKNIARQESEGFTYLDSTMSVAGKTIRKMSLASKNKYLDYYKNTDFKERETLVPNLKKLAENEAELVTGSPTLRSKGLKGLAEIYGDDKEGLKLALESFANLDFQEKEKALKSHEKLVKAGMEKNERDKVLILKGVETKLNTAVQMKTISKKTRKRYMKLFEEKRNEPLDTLKKMYEILVSPTPQAKYKNLASYEVRRKTFEEDLSDLKLINPSIKEEEIKKYRSDYEQESWTGREKIQKGLTRKIKIEKREAEKRRARERELGVTEKDRTRLERVPQKKLDILNAATTYMAEDNPREALKILMLFDEMNPDDPQILLLIELAARQLREMGSKKKKEADTIDKEIEDELETISQSDSKIREELEEQQITTLNIQGVEQSEQRHNKIRSAKQRAQRESLQHIHGEAADIAEEFYELSDDDKILDEEGKGEELKEIKFNDVDMTREQRQELKRSTYEHQNRLTQKEGFVHISLKDKDGKEISAEQAKARQAEKLEKLEEEMTDKAVKKVELRHAAEAPSGGIVDLQQRIAARRKAKGIIDKKRTERLKDKG